MHCSGGVGGGGGGGGGEACREVGAVGKLRGVEWKLRGVGGKLREWGEVEGVGELRGAGGS